MADAVARIDGYELYLPKALEAYERVVRKPPLPKRLYHYTTPAAAMAIIRSQTIWATNVRSMNDTSELTYAENLISEIVESEALKLTGVSQRWPASLKVYCAARFRIRPASQHASANKEMC